MHCSPCMSIVAHTVPSYEHSRTHCCLGMIIQKTDCRVCMCVHIGMSRLVDKVRVLVRAGNGGSGALAFSAHKLKRLQGPGKPCGGNGGRGGDILIRANSSVVSLGSVSPTIVASNGVNGGKERRHGSHGADVYVDVPVGTGVEGASGEQTTFDLVKNGQTLTVARGGAGGKGNNAVSPHTRTEGSPGESRRLILQLQTIADIGLVGFPNAGKSSLLSFVTRATPKIASYPFTTLGPLVGVCVSDSGKQISIADIPGLIKDAHLNSGMGHEFLNHVIRTRALLFVLDVSGAGWNTLDHQQATHTPLLSSIDTLRSEVELFNVALGEKPWAIVCNKMDLEHSTKEIDELHAKFASDKNFTGLVCTSVFTGVGKDRLIDLLFDMTRLRTSAA